MQNIKNAKIGLKIVNSSLIGLKYFRVNKIPHFEAYLSDNNIAENFNKVQFILPLEMVSYKLLFYPFKLKNKKNIDSLVKTALEELTPLNIEEIVILKHRLSDGGLLIEYAKKKKIIDLLTKYNLLNTKKNIELYFPYSLLYKISKNLELNKIENYALIYSFADEYYGIVIKNGILNDIIDLNYITSLTDIKDYTDLAKITGLSEPTDIIKTTESIEPIKSAEPKDLKNNLKLDSVKDFNELKNLTVIDLNKKIKEIYGDIQSDFQTGFFNSKESENRQDSAKSSKSSGISNIAAVNSKINSAEMSNYSDLMFLLAYAGNKKHLPLQHLNSNAVTKKADDSANIFSKAIPVVFLIFLAAILTMLGLAENFYYKNSEKKILEKKINTVLSKYMPQQKVFYEPRFEIKNYYDTIKRKHDSYSSGTAFLKFLKYISDEKRNLKSLTIDNINYSYNKFNFKGKVKGYKSFHGFEIYLKKKYSSVDVIKSYKNSKGFVKFDIILKK